MSAMSLSSRGAVSLAPSSASAARRFGVRSSSGASVVRCSSSADGINDKNVQQHRAELKASSQQQQQRAGAVAAVAGAASTAWAPLASAHAVAATAATAATAAVPTPIAEVAMVDIFTSDALGPAVCVVCTLYIGYVVFTGVQTIKSLKEELTAMGYDVTDFNRVGELKSIRRAVENGSIDDILDKVWYMRSVESVGVGSIVQVQRVQAYWKKKGIDVKTLADLNKVREYMIKKYGIDAKMT